MSTMLKNPKVIETTASDMPGSGALTGDQSALLEGISTRLHGLGYPARKDDILKQAKKNGADQNVLNAIKEVPDRHYDSPTELLKAFGERH